MGKNINVDSQAEILLRKEAEKTNAILKRRKMIQKNVGIFLMIFLGLMIIALFTDLYKTINTKQFILMIISISIFASMLGLFKFIQLKYFADNNIAKLVYHVIQVFLYLGLGIVYAKII